MDRRTRIGAWATEAFTKGPGSYTYGDLRLSPLWDPLRGDPRFETIVNSLAPK